jgi:hypothetical protein
MEIRIRETGAVMYEGELRSYLQANNGPSYEILTPEIAETLGVDVLLEGPQATGGTHYQYSQRSGVEQIDGKWYTKYTLGPVFADGETTAAEQEAAYQAAKDAEQAKSVREQRSAKLAESDWTQLTDAPINSALWAMYRQQLRDVPTQTGFPWEISWPTQP